MIIIFIPLTGLAFGGITTRQHNDPPPVRYVVAIWKDLINGEERSIFHIVHLAFLLMASTVTCAWIALKHSLAQRVEPGDVSKPSKL
ncbi:hypothetical protein DPMN_136546 [Dreissena polymorpha]|uniref:Uncharacterized protein n=1 Tax=Dreissena polymorpha TaxID=45954 RepID=A0A9D4G001_DREPO|nr:hypothetical protein DPMN_136546 [Dreissena polymorpha]